jgi:hypothetical protein
MLVEHITLLERVRLTSFIDDVISVAFSIRQDARQVSSIKRCQCLCLGASCGVAQGTISASVSAHRMISVLVDDTVHRVTDGPGWLTLSSLSSPRTSPSFTRH